MFLVVITLQSTFGWWRFEFLGNGHWYFFFRDRFLRHFKISILTDLKTRFLKSSKNKKKHNVQHNTAPPYTHTICTLPLQQVCIAWQTCRKHGSLRTDNIFSHCTFGWWGLWLFGNWFFLDRLYWERLLGFFKSTHRVFNVRLWNINKTCYCLNGLKELK